MNRVVKVVIRIKDTSDIQRLRRSVREAREQWEDTRSFLKDVSEKMRRYYLAPMMTKLKEYPPERDRSQKVMWTSRRQWRKVMKMWKDGEIDLPTKRSNRMKLGYKLEVSSTSSKIRVRVSNSYEPSQFLVGHLGVAKSTSSKLRYEKPMQPFHRQTGWKPAHTIMRPAYEKSKAYVGRRIARWAGDTMSFDKK